MKRMALASATTLAFLVPGVAQSKPRAGCLKTFTVKMGQRAGGAVYAGTRRVRERELRMLGRIERCQRNPNAGWFVRWFDQNQSRLHRERVRQKELAAQAAQMSYATASWYNDAGQTASGYHAGYGVANVSLAFGTRVLFCYRGRCVDAVVDDRGPYVGGRTWDLNQNVAAALGFDGVDTVAYEIGR